ncbi:MULTISPECIES: Qat anti-phage system QueC-like protein QatC [Paenibacillus]|uniref:7-cyano-7-deazaguanine synthase in queuosine biosynthesis n=1 Tax=Paenibacillus pabuli TaxID=1472 RepID=A0A855Y3Y5_9BACL|nr:MULTISPECIES: Qat anti-phage system QueC-like protein QatC [Paenibacillus]PWW43428.1 hypothetical protein DET56_103476 [Paenibacillus pabuli]PXW09335.1 hypothetical protein DEU73_103473 [Paenibacillus taichungensis]
MNIICKMNHEDKFVIESTYTQYNINQSEIFTYTFWSRDSVKKLLNLPNFFSSVGLDILYISLFVFGADRIAPRNKAYDAWTREINLYIPVLELEKWNKSKNLLESMLNYLSGDIWKIEFRKRELTKNEIKIQGIFSENRNRTIINVNRMCMFSGGLDSFIGAIDTLEIQESNVLFVSHYGGGKGVKEYQDALRGKLLKEYNLDENQFFSFHAAARNGLEDTTRTRSFMFFCHAIALGTCCNENIELLIPENGLISLNIPLTNSRLGSSSTRTTHPFYLEMFQKLVEKLEININLNNPYQFKTKGEMILSCKNFEFLMNNIGDTMSCSHPDQGRMLGETHARHCGSCFPCVIRRASVLRSGYTDNTDYRDINFSSGDTAQENHKSYTIGIEKFDEKYAFLNIQRSGPLKSNINDYTELYIRGMRELKEVIIAE